MIDLSKEIAIFSLLGLLLIGSACSGNNNHQEVALPPATDLVVSLKDIQSEFGPLAKEWHSDSYMLSINMPIGPTSDRAFLYSVVFASPMDSLVLGITKKTNGDVLIERFTGNPLNRPNEAITANDWKLDSLEILELAYKYLLPEYAIDVGGSICGSMVLKRNPSLDGKPVVWRVYLNACGSSLPGSLGNVIIDPRSGVEISSEISP